MAASVASRSSSFIRPVWRSSMMPSLPSPLRSIPPTFRSPQPSRISAVRSPSRFLQRDEPTAVAAALSTLFPAHSAIASARLVSRLPVKDNALCQGKFVNYLSPI
ncbi:hypothetical protein QJS10_CPB13g00788 [Acorus calamus]|uniref:Uncharacterized protein n=1 Tax=Acorus calamus TaxID=4465 RepID=A0AAV9DG40_ACOCL|nr:hypothetical protein QJS10_CPB13g00788 [Acorus calamus]